MQRSIINQKFITKVLYLVIFIVYESLSSIYLFLPPLFSILYLYLSEAFRKNDHLTLLLLTIALLFFEVTKGYLVFSSIIYFILVYRFVMPKIKQNFSCISCINISYVIFSYIGFYIFLQLLSSIFLTISPEINYYIVYYIVIEFLILSLI